MVALTLFALLPQCSFPHHTFFEEDCYNGSDDDGNGLIDCQDPACKDKVLCVPPVPDGWQGPSTIWLGSSPDAAPRCIDAQSSSDPYDLYSGSPSSTSSVYCPPCDCASSASNPVHCEAHMRLYRDASCTTPVGSADTSYSLTTQCQTISFESIPSSNYFLKVEPPVLVNGCVDQSPAPVLPVVEWDAILRSCAASKRRQCGTQQCLDVPPAPFSNVICVYKDTDLAGTDCPAAYPHEIENYGKLLDTRGCSGCNCSPVGNCPTNVTVGDYGSYSGCGQQRRALAINSSCWAAEIPITSEFNYKLINYAEPTGCVATGTPIFSGTVGKGQSVTVCCTAPP